MLENKKIIEWKSITKATQKNHKEERVYKAI